jgi:trans-aconitate methyltransferase
MQEAKVFQLNVRDQIDAQIQRIRTDLGNGVGLGDTTFHARVVGRIEGLETAKDLLAKAVEHFVRNDIDD